MLFRQHRGSIAESMRTQTELKDRPALVEHCRSILGPLGVTFTSKDVRVAPYFAHDGRIGWDETFIVTIHGFGVIGFIDTAC